MKNYLFPVLLGSLILVGCGNGPEETTTDDIISDSVSDSVAPMTETDVTIEDFIHPENDSITTPKRDYQEFYETGELKIEGDYDDNEARHGLWLSYYENGIKWSESNYSHGVRMGHSITFFPNGRVRYVGEYADDKQTGHWIFYDEEGNVVKEEDY
jgi:antitoxin component YwqK of YwqJK toxin-antitoxin module